MTGTGNVVTMTDFEALQLIAEDDQIWFAEHPDRRLRHATDGDWTGAAPDQLMLVFCAVEGVRVRLDCRLAPGFSVDDLREIDSDVLLMRPLFDLIEMLEPEKQAGLMRMLDAALKRGKRLESLSDIPADQRPA